MCTKLCPNKLGKTTTGSRGVLGDLISSYNCSVNRPCVFESLWQTTNMQYIHAIHTCNRAMLLWWCCLKAFYWNCSVLLSFPGIASAPFLLFLWVKFEVGTLQNNAHILLSHQPHSFLFENNQSSYSRCCGVSVDLSDYQITSMIDFILILTKQFFILKWDEQYERNNGIAAGAPFFLSPCSPYFRRVPVLPF